MIEYNTQAIVLDKQTINETDAQIVLYTETLGKIELIAKGAKKITAKLNSHLEILNLIETTIVTVNNKHITSALTVDNFLNIRNQELLLENALKMIKFFNQVIIAAEKDEFLWQSLKHYFSELNKITAANEENLILTHLVNINFLIKLETALGLMPAVEEQQQYFNQPTIKLIQLLAERNPQEAMQLVSLSEFKKIDYNKIEEDLKEKMVL